MPTADFLVIGGGIAGLSAAARLARHGKIVVLEAEEALGHHSSGRSVTFSHYGIGNQKVRALTALSRSFFLDPPSAFSAAPPGRTASALFAATEAMLGTLDALQAAMTLFTDAIEKVDAPGMAALCPVLRVGDDALCAGLFDPAGIRLDADALLQGFARSLRAAGGECNLGQAVTSIGRGIGGWSVRTRSAEEWTSPILINAAGAWADEVAALAGVRPLGLQPIRRTIIVVDPPAEQSVANWPFVKTAADEFYMMPEAGRLLVSPVDETPSPPCDAQPEEYDIALAADRLETFTTMKVRRVVGSWAGLRTFTSDRVPTAGFAPDETDFFWLAGQGGYGLQTAPAMAAAVEALIIGSDWPAELAALGVLPDDIRPQRLFSNS